MDSINPTPATRFEPMPRRWTTMAGSVLVHGIAAVVFVTLSAAAARVVTQNDARDEALTFVRITPPPPLREPLRIPPPVFREVKAVDLPPAPVEIAPERESVVARNEPSPPPVPEPVTPVVPDPPTPVPQVNVGSFAATGNSPRAVEVARAVQQSGFDAPAARAPEIHTVRAAVGAFEQATGSPRPRPGTDRPNVVGDAGFGAGVTTGRGRGGAGGMVTSGGFGSAANGTATGTGTRPQGAVKTTDFDARETQPSAPQVVQAARTEVPLEVLSKPTPVYTDEARAHRIEGEVLLEVEFTATGEIRVLRVVRGLGYGLDESAVRAVQSMRFKPALRNGQPVDTRTTVNVVFRLA